MCEDHQLKTKEKKIIFTTRYFEYNNENVEKIFINSIGIKYLI